MSGNSDIFSDRDERRRLRREKRYAMRGQCDSLAHAVRGPLTLITLGVLFALNNFTPYGFDKTWPVLLIVFGLLTLVGRGTAQVPPAAPEPPIPPPPPYGYTPPAGSYRQSAYTQPPTASAPNDASPAGTAKGGFGASAPPRQADPGQTPTSGGGLTEGQEGRPGGPPHSGGSL